jgi:hypothetical protein
MSKNNINELNAKFDEQLIFYIYRELEYFVKNVIILEINKHLANYKSECSLLRYTADIVIDKNQKGIKINNCFKFLESITIQNILNNISINNICKRSFFKKCFMNNKGEDIMNRWINDKNKDIRNRYAHESEFKITQQYLIKKNDFRFDINRFIDNIVQCVANHKCGKF